MHEVCHTIVVASADTEACCPDALRLPTMLFTMCCVICVMSPAVDDMGRALTNTMSEWPGVEKDTGTENWKSQSLF